MDIKKISFIEAGSPGLHIFSKLPIPRLGAVLLSTILRERGYEVTVFIEDVAEPDWSFIESSDLVCISTIRAMGRFYSWKYIFRHLARLDFHYAAIGIFGKTTVNKTLKVSAAYLDDLGLTVNEMQSSYV